MFFFFIRIKSVAKFSLLVFFLAFFCTGLSFTGATTGIKGRVFVEDGKPLADVDVVILGQNIKVQTAADGTFTIENLPPDTYQVVFYHPDFLVQTLSVAVGEGKTGLVQVTLKPKNPMLLTIKEEITVTAEADSIIDVNLPSHRTILPGSVLAELGSANITEAVDKVPGVAMVGQGGYSMVPAIRGLAEHRVLLLMDGIPITSERRIGTSASFINTNDIDRIEVNRGPYSVFFGSGAVGGIINVITKTPSAQAPFGGKIRLGYNTVRNERIGSLSLSGTKGNYGFLIDVNGKKADDYATPSGKMLQSRYSDYSLLFKLSRESENSQAYLNFFNYRGIDIGKPSPEAKLKPRWYPNEDNLVVNMGYKVKNICFLDVFSANAYLFRSSLETRKENLSESFVIKKRNQARVEGTNLGLKIRAGKASGAHNINFGMDIYGRIGIGDNNTEWSYDGQGSPIGQLHETSLRDAGQSGIGLFVDDKVEMTPLFSLNMGARFDHIQTSNGIDAGGRVSGSDRALTAYIGAVYQVDSHLSFLVNLGRAFRFPSVSELYYSGLTGRGTVFGNPDLDSEKSINLDLGFRYLHKKFFLSAYFFHNSVMDIIQKYGGGPEEEYYYRNLSSARIMGLEGECYFSLADCWEIFLNFHHMTGFDNDDESLNYIPPSRLAVWLKYCPGSFWIEPRVTLTDAQKNPGPLEIETDGYLLLDAILGYKAGPHITLLGIFQNLTNITYRASSDVDGVDAPGRGLILKCSFSF